VFKLADIPDNFENLKIEPGVSSIDKSMLAEKFDEKKATERPESFKATKDFLKRMESFCKSV
jgi:hypothetical protein